MKTLFVTIFVIRLSASLFSSGHILPPDDQHDFVFQHSKVDSIVGSFQYNESDRITAIISNIGNGVRHVRSYQRDSLLNLEEIINSALLKLENQKNPLGAIFLHLTLARINQKNGNQEKTINHEIKASEIAEGIRNVKIKSIAYLTLSNWTSDFGGSLNYSLTMVNLLEESGLIRDFPRAYIQLWNRYSIVLEDEAAAKGLENIDKFLNMIKGEDSLKFVKYGDQEYDIKRIEIAKAVELLELQRFEEAREILDEYDTLRPHLSSYGLAKYLDAKGQYYFRQGQIGNAIPCYLESYKLFYGLGRFNQACYMAIYLAESFHETEQYDQGLKYGLIGYDLALDQYEPLQIRSSAILAQLYDKLGNTEEAFKYLKISRHIERQFNETDLLNRITSAEIGLIREQARIDKIRSDNQERWLSGILAGLLIVIGFSFFLWKSNQQKRITNRRLVETLDDLQSTQSQLIHSEKMASLGVLTTGIAHEIQNPLNFVNNFSDINEELLDDLTEAVANNHQEEIEDIFKSLKENENRVKYHGKRAEQIVKSMLQHSRASDGKKETTNINTICDEQLRLAYHGSRARDKSFNAEFELDLDESIPKIEVVPQDIGRALLNITDNAFQAVADVDKPKVTLSTQFADNSVIIQIADNGPGIPDNIKEKIFQPFFTTRPAGEGTGLGLSMSYDIVTKEHGGSLAITNNAAGKGAVFEISIPV